MVHIVPSSRRSENERQTLSQFRHTLQNFDGIPALIESAKLAIGLDLNRTGLSADILQIEVSGPTRPHLTVVDLPGLIHAKNG